MSSDSQNGSPEPEYLRFAGLSPELQINALQTLGCPVIGIIPDGQQLGSGVLFEVDRVSGILTAEHVVIRTAPQTPPRNHETQAHPKHCPETGQAPNHWHAHHPEQQAREEIESPDLQ
jgi:hypothetical protein